MRSYASYFPMMMLALAFCLFSLRRKLSPKVSIGLSAIFVGYFLANNLILNYPGGYDFSLFRNAGLIWRAGGNPYENVAMVSPPTSMPLFGLFSLADFNVSLAVWTVINIAMALLLVPLAWCCLFCGTKPLDLKCLANDVAPLTAFFVLSLPIFWTIGLGQLAVYEAFLLVTAFLMQARGLPIGAGVSLALATVKPQSALPCLINFLRKDSLKAWIALALLTAALLAATPSAPRILAGIQDELRNIASMSASGNTNDYSFDAPFHHTMIGMNYLLYCIGIRDRALIFVIGLCSTLAIGLVLIVSRRRGAWSSGTYLSVICIYAMLFFYHRTYDAALFAIPMTRSYVLAQRTEGRERAIHVLALMSLLPVLVVHPKAIAVLVNDISGHFLRRLGEVLLLPFATWSVLIALVLTWYGSRLESRKDLSFVSLGGTRWRERAQTTRALQEQERAFRDGSVAKPRRG